MNSERAQEYMAQVESMYVRSLRWRKSNPEKSAVIQFKIPAGACVVATIWDAIEHGFVSVNEAGRELLEAICDKGAKVPTVLMVRAVLELE